MERFAQLQFSVRTVLLEVRCLCASACIGRGGDAPVLVPERFWFCFWFLDERSRWFWFHFGFNSRAILYMLREDVERNEHTSFTLRSVFSIATPKQRIRRRTMEWLGMAQVVVEVLHGCCTADLLLMELRPP